MTTMALIDPAMAEATASALPTTFILGAALSFVIGTVLGMLGGGGGILMLPMFVYVLHIEPHAAIAMSLFVVAATSVVGSTMHARAGTVRFKVGLIFGAAAMAGAFGGGRIARFVPGTALLVLFAAVMLVTATAMLRGRRDPGPNAAHEIAVARVLALGAAVGGLSGLVGAGGGFLIVPALALFGGLSMRDSIGTSLFVISLQSFAGFAGQVSGVSLDWSLVVLVSASAMVGSIGGAAIGKRVKADNLRRAFAWLVLGMGIFIIGKQVSVWITLAVAALTLVVVTLVIRSRRPAPAATPSTTT